MSKRIDVKKLPSTTKLAKATLPSSGGKGTQGKERLAKKVKGIPNAPLEVFPQKKYPTKRVTKLVKSGIPPLTSFVSMGVVLARSTTTSAFPTGDEEALILSSSLVGQVKERRLVKLKEEKEKVVAMKALFELAREKLKKKVAKLKGKEKEAAEGVEFAKTLVIIEFKPFEKKFSEILTIEASRSHGEGFDLCKKQIKLHFPDFSIDNIEIDPDLAKERDGDGTVDSDETLVKDPIP
ncbi:hypothetical protein Acr_00g0012170 [Actinidia rufa]|uniref:Uncharacterized protein n=1 Tax=Actinidia rufa TaxID=165716 RepID=A0A7J0DA89_9ERIC|nr:hypothetical protein Acr_00g0012170 [Actinidia rufa]